MREIEFRGKTSEGKWVHGDLTRYSEEMSYITVDLIEHQVYEVLTKTVGQYIGIQDKNESKIFEGDIITIHGFVGEVKWVQEHSSFMVRTIFPHAYNYINNDCEPVKYIEVIGNIYDNPELLEDLL